MEEKLSLEIGRKELLDLLKKYYTEKLKRDVVVKENHKLTTASYYEEQRVVVDMYYESIINIGGFKATARKDISVEEIKDILSEILLNDGYEVSSIELNTGTRLQGCCMDEYEEPYFKGIKVNIKSNQMKLIR